VPHICAILITAAIPYRAFADILKLIPTFPKDIYYCSNIFFECQYILNNYVKYFFKKPIDNSESL